MRGTAGRRENEMNELHRESGSGMTAIDAVAGRRSIRAFLDTPVPQETVERILEISARAPSGTNLQPWRVHAMAGAPLKALSQELVEVHHSPDHSAYQSEYSIYMPEWREPYLSRRRKVGWDLYTTLGIAKGDKAAMSRQHAKNYEFFGAPVGLFFTIERDLALGSWLDLGMFVENVMIVARAFGLDTCPQQAFCQYHRIVRRHIAIPEAEILVVGMALGHADLSAPENNFPTDRAPVAEFARFTGF